MLEQIAWLVFAFAVGFSVAKVNWNRKIHLGLSFLEYRRSKRHVRLP